MERWVDFRGKMESMKGGGYGFTRGEKLRKLRGKQLDITQEGGIDNKGWGVNGLKNEGGGGS